MGKESTGVEQNDGAGGRVDPLVSERSGLWEYKVLEVHFDDEGKSYALEFRVIDNKLFSIRDASDDPGHIWEFQDINIDVARKLRDFLNYAVR